MPGNAYFHGPSYRTVSRTKGRDGPWSRSPHTPLLAGFQYTRGAIHRARNMGTTTGEFHIPENGMWNADEEGRDESRPYRGSETTRMGGLNAGCVRNFALALTPYTTTVRPSNSTRARIVGAGHRFGRSIFLSALRVEAKL
jgi:hypothetical protein